MTDKAWLEGMAEFQRVEMPGWPYDDPVIAEERARAYRRHLNTLSDGQWLFAVGEAIRACKWFPTVHELLDFGESYRPAYRMLEPARTPDQREIDRETAKRGLERIREECEKAGLILPRSGPLTVELTDERREELKRVAMPREEVKA